MALLAPDGVDASMQDGRYVVSFACRRSGFAVPFLYLLGCTCNRQGCI